MEGDETETTPVIEAKPFPRDADEGKPSSRSGSSTTESSSPVTPERTFTAQKAISSGAGDTGMTIPIPTRGGKESPITPETDMSASYHEIFDTQKISRKKDDDNEADEEIDEAAVDEKLAPLLCCDNNTESTTEYLTSKLVEDSLKWQRDMAEKGGSSASSRTPTDSPIRPRPHSHTLTSSSGDNKIGALKPVPSKKVDILDPTAIVDIENHARYLAACLDNMTENLAGVLQSASALTVDTLEVEHSKN